MSSSKATSLPSSFSTVLRYGSPSDSDGATTPNPLAAEHIWYVDIDHAQKDVKEDAFERYRWADHPRRDEQIADDFPDQDVVPADLADTVHHMLDTLPFEDLAFVEAYHHLARALIRRRLALLDAKA